MIPEMSHGIFPEHYKDSITQRIKEESSKRKIEEELSRKEGVLQPWKDKHETEILREELMPNYRAEKT